MSTLYKRLLSECESRNITGYRMCKDCGVSPSVMTDLKMGRKETLSASNMNKFANYLGVTVGYLLGSEQKENATTVAGNDDKKTDVDRELESLLRNLTDDEKKFIIESAKNIVALRK